MNIGHRVAHFGQGGVALAARAGWIFPRDRDELLPIQEQFFTGGEGTVRGWREKEILPRDSNGLPRGAAPTGSAARSSAP